MTPRRWQADLALASVALIWGSTFVLVKSALADISTVLFLALRFGLAALALWAVLRFRSKLAIPPGRGGWTAGLLTGSLLYGGYLLQTLGLRETTPSKSAFITGLYIVLVPLLAAAIYRKAPSPSEWLGVASAGIGMALMTIETARFEMGRGDILTLGCAVLFACHILALGYYSRRIASGFLALAQITTCAVFAAGSFWWVEPVQVRWTGEVWVALLVTSLLATALAFLVQTWGQRHTTVTRTAIIFALEPVFAWLTSFLVAGEVLTVQATAGAAFIFCGILLVELKPSEGRTSMSV